MASAFTLDPDHPGVAIGDLNGEGLTLDGAVLHIDTDTAQGVSQDGNDLVITVEGVVVASLRFPDTGSRYVFLPSGRPAVGARAYYYSDAALTVPAELYRDVDGVKGTLYTAGDDDRVSIRLDAFGGQQSFWGPASGQDRLYMVVNGVVSVVDADYNARLDVVEAALGDTGGGGLPAEIAARIAGDATSVATAADDATSKADAAQSAAISAAATDATTKAGNAQAAAITTAAADATGKVATHNADTTDVHGIADTAALETVTGSQGKATTALNTAVASSAQRSANLSDLANPGTARTNLGLGTSATRNVGTTSGDVAAGDAPAAAQTAAVAAAATDATAKVAAEASARTSADTLLTPQTRSITAGTGLTGGGTLSADRTLSVAYGTSSTTAARGDDTRLSDPRTPTTHAASHASGGSDPVTVAQSQVTGLTTALGAKADLVGGLVPTSQIPPSSVTFRGDVASQAAMLAVPATKNDYVRRTDTTPNTFWTMIGTDPTQLSSWLQTGSAGAVNSVNSQSGNVVLGPTDVGAVPVGRTVTTTSPLTGGGALSGNLTLGVTTGTTAGTVAAGDAPAAAQAAAISASATDATTKASAAQAAAVQRVNHTGTQSADTLTDGTTNKAFLATERTKLAGVATGATTNATDALLRDRSTHTGTQATSTVTGLDTALAGKADATRTLSTAAPLTGGGDLSTNRTLAVSDAAAGSKGVVQLAGDLGGTAAAPTVPSKVNKGDLRIDPRDAPYNADPTGVADATAGIVAAFTAANALTRAGLTGGIVHPGTTVILRGTFNLATLSAPIDIRCNVDASGATFLVPASYAGVAVLVGHSTSGSILQAANIALPDVLKPTSSPQISGSVGVRVQNLFNSQLSFGRVCYFETGHHYTGDNSGTSYCDVFVGWISYCKVPILMKPHVAGGYANQIKFNGGGIQQSAGYAGGNKVTGWRHVVMDGNNINNVTGNTFFGVSFEGDVSEYVFELRGAYDNVWVGCRHEQGVAGVAVTVSGATLTKTGHGMAVGDMVTFSASVAPTGMSLISPYFVVSTPTADTFTVSAQRGGAAITFTSSGTSVIYFRPQRILVDASTQTVNNNTIQYPMTPLRAIDLIIQGVQHGNNNIQWSDRHILDAFTDSDMPLNRGRNRSGTTTSRPVFAAYPPSASPLDDPYNWTTAIGDRGVLFAESRAEIGRLFASSGILQYRRPADTLTYEVASCRRSPSLITSISGLSVPANTTTTATFTLTDAAVNDHLLVTPVSGVTAGVILSHAYVSSANTVTVTFGNLTASPIVISPTLQAVAFRRFY